MKNININSLIKLALILALLSLGSCEDKPINLDEDNNNRTIIIIIIVVVIILIILLLLCCCCRKKKENEVKEEIEKDNISKLLDNNVSEKKEDKALVEEIKVVNEIKENSNNYYINENQNNENNDGLNTDRTDNSKNEQDNTVSKPRKEKLTMKIKPKAKKSVKDENNN